MNSETFSETKIVFLAVLQMSLEVYHFRRHTRKLNEMHMLLQILHFPILVSLNAKVPNLMHR